ncbi:MAG: 50S ribosomal protein L20 [Planctomycetes bacterium]|nr:50S ribosomal protein L20 [Planctomycetota bacterium]
MARVTNAVATRRRRKRVLRDSRGSRASLSKLFKNAKQNVIKGGQYAYRDRRAKKRNFRALWIVRVTAACRARGISYSVFMHGLSMANVILNRKMLSEVAIADSVAFDKLVELAKAQVGKAAA